MKNYYTISRKILCILAVIISLIASIHEDISVKIVAVMLFFLITLAASFSSSGSIGEKSALELSVAVTPRSSSLWLLLLLMMEA